MSFARSRRTSMLTDLDRSTSVFRHISIGNSLISLLATHVLPRCPQYPSLCCWKIYFSVRYSDLPALSPIITSLLRPFNHFFTLLLLGGRLLAPSPLLPLVLFNMATDEFLGQIERVRTPTNHKAILKTTRLDFVERVSHLFTAVISHAISFFNDS
jgi:hypothetical protein